MPDTLQSFATARLTVAPLGAASDAFELAARLATPEVTAFLPDDLVATADTDPAAWFHRLMAGGEVLLVSDAAGPVGCLTLHPGPEGMMFGYLLERAVWGRGYATELVHGLVTATRASGHIDRLMGGVDPANSASAAVLRKAGFQPAGTLPSGADLFALAL